jgi:putative transposase
MLNSTKRSTQNPPKDGMDLYLQLAEYFNYYDHERRHESLDYELPAAKFRQAA